MHRRHNPPLISAQVALAGAGVLGFFLLGKVNQLGPLQGVYNSLRGTAGSITAPQPGTAGGAPPAIGSSPGGTTGCVPSYTFIPGVQYVAAAPGGGWIVVTKAAPKGTFSDLNQAQNYYNSLIASCS